jgi:hypothetical protein
MRVEQMLTTNHLKKYFEKRSIEISLANIEEDGSKLRFVPICDRTIEFCLAAVKQDGWNLRYVPNELITPELCVVAVGNNVNAFYFVPEEFLSEDNKSLLMAVKQDGLTIRYVPESILMKEDLLRKYSREELLTSDKIYLRKLGLEYV